MGAQSQPNSNPSVNAPNALLAAGQAVATPVVPTTLIPVHDKNGKQIMVTVNGVRAIIQGYDKATGKLHLTCADTEENQKNLIDQHNQKQIEQKNQQLMLLLNFSETVKAIL